MYCLLRLLKILVLTVYAGVQFVALPSRRPVIVRRWLEQCGGAFIKLGQLLAMRYDFLPPEYPDALMSLLDELKAVPFADVRETVERELAAPLDVHFSKVEESPVSTASVAQVHRGKLTDGTEVAVKVQRPNIEREYRCDLRLLKLAAIFTDWIGLVRSFDLMELVDELEFLANEELDFRIEMRNAFIMRENMLSDQVHHYVPKVYPDLSSQRVLTLEWLEGVPVSEVLRATVDQDSEALEHLSAQGVTPALVAETLFSSIVTQCFTHRLFHADPHAANLLWLPSGQLGYVDFGMVGWIDERTWEQQFRLNYCIARGEIDGAYQAVLDALEPLSTTDLRQFEMSFKRILQGWRLATQLPTHNLRDRSMAMFYVQLFGAIRKHGLRSPLPVVRLNRAFIVSDVLVLRLQPEMRRLPLLKRYFSTEIKRQLSQSLTDAHSPMSVQKSLVDMVEMPTKILQLSHWLTARLPSLSRDFGTTTSRLEQVAERGLRQIRLLLTLATIVIVVGPVFESAGVAPFESLVITPDSLRWTAAVGTAVLTLSVNRLVRTFR